MLLYFPLLIAINFAFYVSYALKTPVDFFLIRTVIYLSSILLGFLPALVLPRSLSRHTILVVGSIFPFLLAVSFNEYIKYSEEDLLRLITGIKASQLEAENRSIYYLFKIPVTFLCAVGEEVWKLLTTVVFLSLVGEYPKNLPVFFLTGALIGIGFSISENFSYFGFEYLTSNSFYKPVAIGLARSLASMHALMTSYAAGRLALRRRQKIRVIDFFLSLWFPCLMHFFLNLTVTVMQPVGSHFIFIKIVQTSCWLLTAAVTIHFYRSHIKKFGKNKVTSDTV
jgi:PrsW family intramembrane metalloprotease